MSNPRYLGLNAMARELGVRKTWLKRRALDGLFDYEHTPDGKRLFFDPEATWRRMREVAGRGPAGASAVALIGAKAAAKALYTDAAVLNARAKAGEIPCFFYGERILFNLDALREHECVRILEKEPRSRLKGWRRDMGLPLDEADDDDGPDTATDSPAEVPE